MYVCIYISTCMTWTMIKSSKAPVNGIIISENKISDIEDNVIEFTKNYENTELHSETKRDLKIGAGKS